MKSVFTLCAVSFLFVCTTFSQTTTFEKECRLAGGGGFANGFGNAFARPDLWLQMSYRLSKNFSVATEFEDMSFGRSTYYDVLRLNEAYNTQGFYDDYMSFLIKYHLPLKSKFTVSVVSGWSYVVRRVAYYRPDFNNGNMSISLESYSQDDFGIPFIAEAFYPIGKIFAAVARVKYNLNSQSMGATYSAGLGLSMKL